MRKTLVVVLATVLIADATPAMADFFAVDVDLQSGYTWVDKVQRPGVNEMATLEGGIVGVHGKLEILFLSLVVDYQHFLSDADLLHVGLGADFKLDLSVVAPYVRGSVGLMMLYAAKGAFSPETIDDYQATAGFQARAGVGLDIPLGDWFALGAVVDVGVHYLDEVGYDLSVTGYVGLRI